LRSLLPTPLPAHVDDISDTVIYLASELTRAVTPKPHLSAAYIGASNGDHPEFYGIVETPESSATELLDVFKLVPVAIDTHDEQAE